VLFRSAKAATAAAIAVLLAAAGLGRNQVQRVVICGAFGRWLDVGHARAVGLLPEFPTTTVELLADATLGGCETWLMSLENKAQLEKLEGCLRFINVTLVIWYEDKYIEELRLRKAGATE
jgi:uncharacterized 2Fe-2S/4Fe-4S cluster protein (DUF4445 family)